MTDDPMQFGSPKTEKGEERIEDMEEPAEAQEGIFRGERSRFAALQHLGQRGSARRKQDL